MEQSQVASIVYDAVMTILIVSAPMLVIGLVAGLIISVLQATTQINEQTIVFVVKILSVFLTLIIFGAWMLSRLTEFTQRVFTLMSGGG
ncbi:MAG: flagellar biosynthesis protein FliQ [Oscillospiraceae bacterium]|jgi:flagellar biosynthetic protein FliQ|nr:flagellar biosynthesis protein FliQ [Oscillospiraceae bacterium]